MDKPNKLFNRNFFILWQGQTVSRLGQQGFSIAMILWIQQETGSASLMGFLLMLASIPGVILGPFGGTLADLFSRKKIIVFSDLSRAIAVLALTVFILLNPEATDTILIAIFLVALFNATVFTFFGPAITASIPELVPTKSVAAANSLGQMSAQFTMFIGQGIGAVLFRVLGAPLLFLVNGLSFIYATISDSLVNIPQEIPEQKDSFKEQWDKFKEDLVEGFRYVLQKPGLRDTVLVSAAIAFFTAPMIILMPFFVEDFLQVRIDWYGYILAIYSIGALFGYIFAGVLRLPARTRGRVMHLFILLQAVGYGLFGVVRDPYTALALAFFGGLFSGYIIVNITTIIQLTTPSEMRGRIFGILATISSSLAPIAIGLSGLVADLVDQNIPIIFIVSGLIMTIIVIAVSFNPRFREFLASGGEETTGQEGEQVEA